MDRGAGDQMAGRWARPVAPSPRVSRISRRPDAAVLSISKETEGVTVATVANIRSDRDWIFEILAAVRPWLAIGGRRWRKR
jgi:hypothetical protein